MQRKNEQIRIRDEDIMSSMKSNYIFGVLFFFYICVQLAAWAEKNDKTEHYIKMPNMLSKILFPFKKNTRVRMDLCVMSGYIEISSILIFNLIFFEKNLNWKDINAIWVILFLVVSFFAGTIECIRSTFYEEKDRNLLYKLLSWMGCAIAFIITIGWLAFAIYYLVNYFKY